MARDEAPKISSCSGCRGQLTPGPRADGRLRGRGEAKRLKPCQDKLVDRVADPLLIIHLGRRDRLLADRTVTAKNAELEAVKATCAETVRAQTMKYTDDVNTLKEALATCQHTLSTFTENIP